MAKAKSGDTVKVHYTGKLNDGSVFETSSGREPLEFKIGEGQILPKFEEAIVGMSPGDKKTTLIVAEDAYGPHISEMVFEVESDKFPDNFEPKLGERLQIPQPDGRVVVVTVTKIGDEKVTLDANHPMAGQDLTFELELVAIA